MLTGAVNLDVLLDGLAVAGMVLLVWTLASVVVALLWTVGIVRCRLLIEECPTPAGHRMV